MEAGLFLEDWKRREAVIEAVKSAVRECVGVDAVEVEFARSVMGKDWVVLEYEARTKFAAL